MMNIKMLWFFLSWSLSLPYKIKSMTIFSFSVKKNYRFHSSHSLGQTCFHYRNAIAENIAFWLRLLYCMDKEDLICLQIPCLNFYSRMWLQTHRYLVDNFTPTEKLILKIFLWTGLINIIMYYEIGYTKWNCEYQDLICLSLMTLAMKEFLKYSDLL